jgi:hypothetical protein
MAQPTRTCEERLPVRRELLKTEQEPAAQRRVGASTAEIAPHL